MRNTDTVPAMLTPGEHVASNAALNHVLGRQIIPAANKLAKHITKLGAGKKQPKKQAKKKDEKEKRHNMKEESLEPQGYADGVLSQQGVQMPKLGTTPPMQGIQRQGNSFSHIPGVNMAQAAPKPQPTVMAGYNTQGYADGTLESMGVQRQGNSYSKARTRPAAPPNVDNNTYQAPVLGQANPMPSTDHYQAMQDKVAGLRGGLYSAVGYADGTMDEGGIRPPGFMETVKGILGADEAQPTDTARPDLASTAPTLDEAKGNYELQNGLYKPQKFADGTTDEYGVKKNIGTAALNFGEKPMTTAEIIAKSDAMRGITREPVAAPVDTRGMTTDQIIAKSRELNPPGVMSQISTGIGDAARYAGNNIARSAEMFGDAYMDGAKKFGNRIGLGVNPTEQPTQAPPATQNQAAQGTSTNYDDVLNPEFSADLNKVYGNDQPAQQGSTISHNNGVNTLSGNGYSVSSKSPNLGTHSTPESLAQLDSTIAYNARPEVRAKYQANADAYYANEAQKAEQARLANLEDIALNGGGRADQSFTDMFANNKRQKAAQAILGINTDAGLKRQGLGIEQQKLAQNQNQFEASGKAASSKAEQDYKVELGKLGLDLQKLDRTEYGMTTDPNTGEQVSYPKAGKGADINFQVQSEYANRMNHPQYKQLVESLGQQQADAMFMQRTKDHYFGLAKQPAR